jgi:hypothetical protein
MAVAGKSTTSLNTRQLNTLYDQAVQEAQWKAADEARMQPPAPIRTTKKYLFRFRPGTGHLNFSLKLPHLPDTFESERHEKVLTRKFEQNRKRVDGENPKYNLSEIQDEIGRDWIRFTPMPGNRNRQSTSYYATDNEQIAALLRKRIKEGRGPFRDMVEERPTELIEINGVSIPNTTEGWEAARFAATNLSRNRSLDEE